MYKAKAIIEDYRLQAITGLDKYERSHCPEGRQPAGSLETSDHLLVYRVYQDLREGLDPERVEGDRATT